VVLNGWAHSIRPIGQKGNVLQLSRKFPTER
jgi:hypothetical protein